MFVDISLSTDPIKSRKKREGLGVSDMLINISVSPDTLKSRTRREGLKVPDMLIGGGMV